MIHELRGSLPNNTGKKAMPDDVYNQQVLWERTAANQAHCLGILPSAAEHLSKLKYGGWMYRDQTRISIDVQLVNPLLTVKMTTPVIRFGEYLAAQGG